MADIVNCPGCGATVNLVKVKCTRCKSTVKRGNDGKIYCSKEEPGEEKAQGEGESASEDKAQGKGESASGEGGETSGTGADEPGANKNGGSADRRAPGWHGFLWRKPRDNA